MTEKINLSCHLESSDSVRTGPNADDSEQHSNRFYAEAFSRLLFGERLHVAQIPVLDSIATLQFLSDLIRSLSKASESLGDRGKLTASPFVMCHYPGLSADHKWNTEAPGYWKQVYPITLANRLRLPGYRLSAMPQFDDDDLRGVMADWFCDCVQTNDSRPIPIALDSSLNTETKSHLDRMVALGRYFRDHRSAVQPNVGQHINLLTCFQSAVDASVTPDEPELRPLVDFYRDIVKEQPDGLIRSKVYKRIDDTFSDNEHVWLAQELADSFYMWDLARCAGAGVEVTSSGIASGNAQLTELGNVVSKWADESKALITSSEPSSMPFRPILQRGNFTGIDSFSKPGYRESLTDGLVSLLLTTDIFERRVNILQGARTDPNAVLDFWQSIVEMVSQHAMLKELITANVDVDGILVCRFHVSPDSTIEVASLTDDSFLDEDVQYKAQEALQSAESLIDSDGSVIDIDA